ncbi:integrase [Aureimonas leprariae]|uniref:Integrase n=1 Tax=Plantimonas leprariae TaxID=2615207 RepID=A0A7V7PK67_9HYPH|nr:integrase [Aureimonas leprariae]KAB0675729.1 integrase [Aureimonas leprariae]
MALMVGALYDALRSANVDDDKARRAAEEVADFQKQIATVDASVGRLEQKAEGRFTLLQWMLGVNLAISITILFKVFS